MGCLFVDLSPGLSIKMGQCANNCGLLLAPIVDCLFKLQVWYILMHVCTLVAHHACPITHRFGHSIMFHHLFRSSPRKGTIHELISLQACPITWLDFLCCLFAIVDIIVDVVVDIFVRLIGTAVVGENAVAALICSLFRSLLCQNNALYIQSQVL